MNVLVTASYMAEHVLFCGLIYAGLEFGGTGSILKLVKLRARSKVPIHNVI